MSDNGAEPPNPRKTSVPAGRSGLPDTELPTLSQTIGAGGGPPDKADEEFSPNLPVPGRMWGKYLIEKSLGRGGQAEVYQAFDRSGLAGHVALKVPREPVPTSSVETWSAAECGPLVQLDHPHIVRALDAGCIHGVPYVATQLVQGLPLDAHAKSRPPSDGQILEWMVQLADALVCAHGRGIVHRDIKPRNVIVTSEGRPLLLDFGIATLLSAYQSDHGAGVSGTPTFMPPEQARGDPGADHRVDVFALGGVLKYLLEGVGPYGQTDEPLEAARRGQIQPADERAGPPTRRGLARVANRAAEADPDQRYRNADEMRRALRRLKGRTRRKVLAVAVAVLALAAVAAVAAVVAVGDGSSDSSNTAAARLAVARADRAFVEKDLGAAKATFERVLAMPAVADGVRADALAGLGRIASMEGDPPTATKRYTEALARDAGNFRALVGLTCLLVREQKHGEASDLLRARPGDEWLVRLVERWQQRDIRLRRREVIHRLIDELLEQYKKDPNAGRAEDPWTSRRVAVCFCRIQSRGGPAYHEGEDAFLVGALAAKALEAGPFDVVERNELDAILSELRLATTGLADPRSALRFGELRIARAMVFVTVYRDGPGASISARVVDTETTRIRGMVSAEVKRGEVLHPTTADEIAAKLTPILWRAFPLRGRITEVMGDKVRLNIGRAVGVRERAVFTVLADDGSNRQIGELSVTRADDASAEAAVVKSNALLEESLRVQAKLPERAKRPE